MDAELLDMFPHTVSVEPFTSDNNVHGDPSWGAAVDYKAMVVGENRIVRNYEGLLVPSNVYVIFSQVVPIHPRDRVTLPTGYVPNDKKPPILKHDRWPDPITNTEYLTRIYL